MAQISGKTSYGAIAMAPLGKVKRVSAKMPIEAESQTDPLDLLFPHDDGLPLPGERPLALTRASDDDDAPGGLSAATRSLFAAEGSAASIGG